MLKELKTINIRLVLFHLYYHPMKQVRLRQNYLPNNFMAVKGFELWFQWLNPQPYTLPPLQIPSLIFRLKVSKSGTATFNYFGLMMVTVYIESDRPKRLYASKRFHFSFRGELTYTQRQAHGNMSLHQSNWVNSGCILEHTWIRQERCFLS